MDFCRTLSYLLQLYKINQKVSFYKIASEASYVIIFKMFQKKWLPGKMILAEFVVIMKMSEIMSHFKFAISTSAAVVLCLLLADKQLIFSNQKNQFFSKRGRQSTQWEFIMSWFFTLFSELKCMTQNGLHACMYQPWEKPFFQRKIISAKKNGF